MRDRLKSGKRIDQEPDGSYPPLYRLYHYAIDLDGGMTLSTGRTNFPEFLATNVEHPEWRSLYGSNVMSDALAFSVVLVSSDGLVLLGRRSLRLADRGGEFHVVPSGHPHPPASIFEGAYAELKEETGIEPSEVSATVCTGLVRTRRNSKPELTYFMKSSISMREIVERDQVDAWEFTELFTIHWSHDVVSAWLHDHVDNSVPPGHGALLLAGRVSFGAQWWEDNVRILGVRT